LVRLASMLSVHCVKKQCGLAGFCFGGRTALDLRLSFVRTGVATMIQD
jgi:dienelactone hydrolase